MDRSRTNIFSVNAWLGKPLFLQESNQMVCNCSMVMNLFKVKWMTRCFFNGCLTDFVIQVQCLFGEVSILYDYYSISKSVVLLFCSNDTKQYKILENNLFVRRECNQNSNYKIGPYLCLYYIEFDNFRWKWKIWIPAFKWYKNYFERIN